MKYLIICCFEFAEHVKPEDISSTLSSDGVLTVTAPLKHLLPAPHSNERAVPITQIPAAASEQLEGAQMLKAN